jgi:hypothetical protein
MPSSNSARCKYGNIIFHHPQRYESSSPMISWDVLSSYYSIGIGLMKESDGKPRCGRIREVGIIVALCGEMKDDNESL